MRKHDTTNSLLLVALTATITMAAGCDEPGPDPQPLDGLHFPTDLMLGGADGDVLYVVSTNFDRRYSGGAVQAIDLAALYDLIGDVGLEEEPVYVHTVPWMGGVNIGSFGGRIARATLPGGEERLFVPLRGEGGVAIIDVSRDGMTCYPEGGFDCLHQAYDLPVGGGFNMADPFAAAVVGDGVFISALRTQDPEPKPGSVASGFMARLSVSSPEDLLVRSIGPMVVRDLVAAPDGVNLLAVGARTQTVGSSRTGIVGGFSAVAFEEEEEIPAWTLSLLQAVGSSDGRSLVFSDAGERAYALSRSPSTLVVFDADPLDGSLRTRSTIPLPDSPSRIALFEDSGVRFAAITATRAGALAIVDLNLERVVAVLDGTTCSDLGSPCPDSARSGSKRAASTDVGLQPWAVVATTRPGGGARLLVSSFDDATIRVVDLLDLRRPESARVVAVVGAGRSE